MSIETINAQALDFEKSILYLAISEPWLLDRYGDQLPSGSFTDPALGCLWGALVDLHAAGANVSDFALLVSRLRKLGVLEKIGGQSALMAIGSHGGTAPNAERYVGEILEAARRRKLIQLAGEIRVAAEDATVPAAETAERLEAQLLSMQTATMTDAPQTLGDASADVLAEIRSIMAGTSQPGIPTGLDAIDEVTSGLFPTELTILAARTSIGKTALAMSIAMNVARQSGPVLVASLEMSQKDLAMRILAGEIRVAVRKLRAAEIKDHQLSELESAVERCRSIPMHVWAPRTCTMSRLRATARVQKAMTGLQLLVVDYLALLTPADRRTPRHEQVAQFSRELKALARELEVPVLALSQLNREADKDQQPRLHHLRESGAIEQDADNCWLLHRDDRASTKATLDLAKLRQGSTGEVELEFVPDRTIFRDPLPAGMEWSPNDAQREYEELVECE